MHHHNKKKIVKFRIANNRKQVAVERQNLVHVGGKSDEKMEITNKIII